MKKDEERKEKGKRDLKEEEGGMGKKLSHFNAS